MGDERRGEPLEGGGKKTGIWQPTSTDAARTVCSPRNDVVTELPRRRERECARVHRESVHGDVHSPHAAGMRYARAAACT